MASHAEVTMIGIMIIEETVIVQKCEECNNINPNNSNMVSAIGTRLRLTLSNICHLRKEKSLKISYQIFYFGEDIFRLDRFGEEAKK